MYLFGNIYTVKYVNGRRLTFEELPQTFLFNSEVELVTSDNKTDEQVPTEDAVTKPAWKDSITSCDISIDTRAYNYSDLYYIEKSKTSPESKSNDNLEMFKRGDLIRYIKVGECRPEYEEIQIGRIYEVQKVKYDKYFTSYQLTIFNKGTEIYLYSEEVEKIEFKNLTKDEFKYLYNVIKPYLNRIIWVTKVSTPGDKYTIKLIFKDNDSIVLPEFSKEDNMYKGLEEYKYYDPEELTLVRKRLEGYYVCINSNSKEYTKGRIYQFNKGITIKDNKEKSKIYNTLEELNRNTIEYEFIKLVE